MIVQAWGRWSGAAPGAHRHARQLLTLDLLTLPVAADYGVSSRAFSRKAGKPPSNRSSNFEADTPIHPASCSSSKFRILL